MITLDPDFVGSLAPPSKLTYTNTTPASDGNKKRKPPIETDVPFRKLSRLERLKAQGKADETEIVENFEEDGVDTGEKNTRKAEKEKMKMRGKGKALKRYLKKKRKNVIEPSAVSCNQFSCPPTLKEWVCLDCDQRKNRETTGGTQAREGKREKTSYRRF